MLLLLPPAQIQVAPAADRDMSFQGFNGFPLKASVRAGSSHPYFAVLVADSGPVDRNGSSPWRASHGGRDFAAWLQEQGLGSLRYDKRFAGSRDPKLDVSLDAQVGDIRAALAFARSLPEARGRKLLLLGHGEGALLSLLATQDADALLLVAMPAQTMAGTITGQVRAQIPSSTAGPNLAYLESVLQAIRHRDPTPAGGPDVHPGLVKMARSLMAPETLDFVRSTLDLDPWKMLERTAIPVALAWGDHDIQSPRPERIPPSFRGAVLDLPGANHFLKREARPRSILTNADAASTYGDETPLADLAPLADWLKQLGRAQ